MGRIVRSCLQSVLKLVNSVGGLVGVGLILYSFWMMRVWYREIHADPTRPWFIYTFLGLGVSLCLIACSGHIASETDNGHCLSCYMVLVFLLVMLEAAVTADIVLNNDWEEDFPVDTTGRFKEFKHFIKSNFDFCKWIGLVIVAAQVTSIFIAMILKALGPSRGNYYDTDDDSVPSRLPLLRNQVQHSPYTGDSHVPVKSDSWNVR
ncbi:tetraspanin-19 isoform X1 [Canna indica]|uniref:Tetraspanin-19 isoform X1 n=1 Tax=Canna indica TaxID=4628 RepID=A0AAQ3KD55_9LILI|nr:tetraspanin-19 isoform X1 [Canna indica]